MATKRELAIAVEALSDIKEYFGALLHISEDARWVEERAIRALLDIQGEQKNHGN